MKVAVVSGENIPSYYAHSFSVMKMAQGFQDSGCDVEVLTANSLKTIVRRRKMNDIYKHYGISGVRFKWIMPSLFGFVTGRTAHDKLFNTRVAEYAQATRIDLAYCRSYLAPVFTVEKNISTIVETHNTNYDHPGLKEIYKVSRSDAFKGLVTIHNEIKNQHATRGVPEEKILVLEDGVDLKSFEISNDRLVWRDELNLDREQKYAVYCGHLYPEKGIETILRTAKRLESRKDIHFLIVGGFEINRKNWLRYCVENRISNVTFTGFVNNDMVPKYLKCADCLLLPYDPDLPCTVMDINTTSPLKMFEYMAAKRPIVATDIPTVGKVLKDGRNSILVQVELGVEGFSLGILRALDDAQSIQLAQNAYEDVKCHTWRSRCDQILALNAASLRQGGTIYY